MNNQTSGHALLLKMSPSLSQSPHLNESLFPQSAKRGSEFNPLSCDVRSVRKSCQLWSLEPVLWSAVMVKLPSQMPQATTKTHILIIHGDGEAQPRLLLMRDWFSLWGSLIFLVCRWPSTGRVLTRADIASSPGSLLYMENNLTTS